MTDQLRDITVLIKTEDDYVQPYLVADKSNLKFPDVLDCFISSASQLRGGSPVVKIVGVDGEVFYER